MIETLSAIGNAALAIVLEAGIWIIVSLFVAGLIHEFLDTSWVRNILNRSDISSVTGALVLGALLPICSCGVIPLSVSLYLSGVRLAAVMTFTAATPIINPAAVVLSYALLGPELTLAYVVFGLVAPVAVGFATERWGGHRLTPVATRLQSCCSETASCCADLAETPRTKSAPLSRRLRNAMRWGFGEFGPTLGLYIGIGALLAGALETLVPTGWITGHLGGSASFIPLLFSALFGASIYVCAVAHIPVVAAFLAAGAGPGFGIVFLVTGAATNLPEFFALQRTLGTRIVAIYVGGLIGLSLLAGWGVNLWLAPNYRPVMDPLRSIQLSDFASNLSPVLPDVVTIVSAALVLILIVWGAVRWVTQKLHAVQQI
jgi:uncharacterized membrane protein YraQ (UPF0718 family)